MVDVSRHVAALTGEIGSHKLLQDSMPLVVKRKTLVESKLSPGRKALVLAGQFQKADYPNANQRIYEEEILKHAVNEIQDDIKARRVLGECDHPEDAKIHLDRVSHLITKLWTEGKTVFGELEVIEGTPMGSIAKSFIDSSVQLGISSRGVGDMETTIREGEEFYRVLPGYTLITFDMVAEPSVKGSYLSIRESRDRLLKVLKSNTTKNIREEAEHKLIEMFGKKLREAL